MKENHKGVLETRRHNFMLWSKCYKMENAAWDVIFASTGSPLIGWVFMKLQCTQLSKLAERKFTDWNTFCLCVGCVEAHECYAGRSWKRKNCCSVKLVVSLGTERSLSISELSAGREWHWPIKRQEGRRCCASHTALVNYLQESFQSPQWRMQLKKQEGSGNY